MQFLISFNLVQHLPHRLSGNNKCLFRSIIWEKAWHSPPTMENTLEWSLSSSNHGAHWLTVFFKEIFDLLSANQKSEPENHTRKVGRPTSNVFSVSPPVSVILLQVWKDVRATEDIHIWTELFFSCYWSFFTLKSSNLVWKWRREGKEGKRILVL